MRLAARCTKVSPMDPPEEKKPKVTLVVALMIAALACVAVTLAIAFVDMLR